MKSLQQLWQAIEAMPGPMAVSAKWQELLGDEHGFVSSYLRPTAKLAASYPRVGDPGHQSPYSVIEHGPEDYVGVCPDGGDTITLAKGDLIIYELDRRKLHLAIVQAIGIEYEESKVQGLPHTQRIGIYRPCAGYSFAVYLTIPLEPSDLTQAVHALAAACGEPFVLLAPTNRRLRPEAESVIRQAKACFLPLSEALAVSDQGKWVATPIAQKAIESFRTAHLPPPEGADGVVFFPAPAHATWSDVHIRFVDGHTVSVAVGEASGTYLYSDMGMADGRSKKPNKQWELLRSLAKAGGVLTWNSPDAERRNQKRRERLSAVLQQFFRIEGDPIAYDEEIKGWRTLFTLEPDA